MRTLRTAVIMLLAVVLTSFLAPPVAAQGAVPIVPPGVILIAGCDDVPVQPASLLDAIRFALLPESDTEKESPTEPTRWPIETVALAALATKRRESRRARGVKKSDVPMYLDSDVHVMRDDKLEVIRGGVMLDDTDLDDEEIEDIKRHGVVRPAKPDEIEAAEAAASKEKRAQMERDHADELRQLEANQAVERAKLENDGKASPAAVQKMDDAHLKARQELQAKHAKALAAE